MTKEEYLKRLGEFGKKLLKEQAVQSDEEKAGRKKLAEVMATQLLESRSITEVIETAIDKTIEENKDKTNDNE